VQAGSGNVPDQESGPERSVSSFGHHKSAARGSGCNAAGLPHHELDALVDTDPDEVSIGTMHLARGWNSGRW